MNDPRPNDGCHHGRFDVEICVRTKAIPFRLEPRNPLLYGNMDQAEALPMLLAVTYDPIHLNSEPQQMYSCFRSASMDAVH